MAAIDKMHEFYTCAKRFSFLINCYMPEDLPPEIKEALYTVYRWASDNKEFNEKIEESEEWFEELNERIEMNKRKDLLSALIRECTR